MDVGNTEADVFFHTGDRYFYFLASGRWFRASSDEGPWEAATLELPEDFALIPTDHRRAHVRAAVRGTPEAEEAVLLASVPRTATVSRDEAKAEVQYVGEPEFSEIEGTEVAYAINTAQDVLQVGNEYYLCEQGVWFRSFSPEGPWELADTVPQAIYSIPVESPKNNVTYVQVYDSTPTTVVYGYTSGYTGVYISYGMTFWGSGWYYPPHYWYGPYPYPIYYPYPFYTYGARAWYNPWSGTYYRGASVYGPYGGYGRGAAYNGRTGTYYRGERAWGPNGSAWRGASYNPRTDTFTRAGGGVNYWNDAYAAGYRSSNPYASWGEALVGQGDDWVHGARYRDERGAIGGARTSEGGGVIRANTDERQGFIGRDQDNNIYAGRDGNVYRSDEDGNWTQRDDGGNWNDVPSEAVDRAREQGREEIAGRVSPEQREALENRAQNMTAEQREALRSGAGQLSTEQRSAIRDRASSERVQPGALGSADRARPQPGQLPGSSGAATAQPSRSEVVRGLERDAQARRQASQRMEQHRTWQRSNPSRTQSPSRGMAVRRGGSMRRR